VTRAQWQSGDAPAGVIEYHLGSLRPGQRFILYMGAPKKDIHGIVLDPHPCAVLVELDKQPGFREFVFIDKETGAARTVKIPNGPKRITWAATTAVGIEPEEI
jgi:hypothetical protein